MCLANATNFTRKIQNTKQTNTKYKTNTKIVFCINKYKIFSLGIDTPIFKSKFFSKVR